MSSKDPVYFIFPWVLPGGQKVQNAISEKEVSRGKINLYLAGKCNIAALYFVIVIVIVIAIVRFHSCWEMLFISMF